MISWKHTDLRKDNPHRRKRSIHAIPISWGYVLVIVACSTCLKFL